MTNINDLLEVCKGIVMNCSHNVLILSIFGEIKVYIARQVTLKSRECPYNEVLDAQEITPIIENISFNASQGWNEKVLLEKVQSIHKQDFKFETNEYMWITNVSLNKG